MLRSTARALTLSASFAALLTAHTAHAQIEKSEDYTKGQALIGVCSGCHGADGMSPIPSQPNLAGMGWQYIVRQLSQYKSGQRDNPIMKPFADPLSDADMKAIAIYYSAQKPKTLGTPDITTAKTAERLFRGGDAERGIPACAACHSPTGAGIPGQYPRIGSQHAEYTLAQLVAFKSGKRGAPTEQDSNFYGQIMVDIAKKLTDDELKALALYSAGLKVE